jgi:hypothetical protein
MDHAQKMLACLGFVSATIAVAGIASADPIGTSRSAIVYGEDGRKEAQRHPDPALRTLADERSVALVPRTALTFSAGSVAISAPTLASAMNVCASESFAQQPMLAECSGTWLGDDLVLTAGHCVDDEELCRSLYFVFGFSLGTTDAVTLDAGRVFECDSVLAREVSAFDAPEQLDYAVVRLDRPVDDGEFLGVRRELANPGERLVLIGNGLGLPTKIDDAATVIYGRPLTRDYFEVHMDNFHRGSGSGVFDEAHRLIGIAVRGSVDFDGGEECLALRKVPDSHPHSEEVTYAAAALDSAGFGALVADGPASTVSPGCSVGGAGRRSLEGLAVFAAACLTRARRRARANTKNTQQEEPWLE